MKIKVLTYDNEYKLDLNDEFTCAHVNAEIEDPCCNGNNCGCHGVESVSCDDCNNYELTDDEAEAIFNSKYGY